MNKSATKLLTALAVTMTLGISMNAFGFLGLGGTKWREEVLLHNGSKIVVERQVERGGRHEIGQKPPIKEQSLAFTLPSSNERVIWTATYSKEVGYADLRPLLLDIIHDVPYLVTDPVGCLAYNLWKRPNPPYIFLRYENSVWRQIELQNVPVGLKGPNLIISSPDTKIEMAGKRFMTAADIAKLNSSLTQSQYKSIVREALPADKFGCPEMISDGKGGWTGVGFFRDQPSYEACVDTCNNFHIEEQYCPCNRYFKKGK